MLKELAIAIVLAVVLVGIARMAGLIPFGNEPIETAWRIPLTMGIGLLVGISAGFSWLQSFQKDHSYSWPVLAVIFVSAAVCGLEVTWCLENNFTSVYSVPVAFSGPVSLGAVIGGLVRTLR